MSLGRNFPNILLFLTLSTLSVDCLLREDIIRVQTDTDGWKYVVVRDFERIVAFQFTPDNVLANCQVDRRNPFTQAMVEFEEENTSGGFNVQYVRQEIDVARYARDCARFIRNKLRSGDRTHPLDARFLDLHVLGKGLPETKFCSSKGGMCTSYNSRMKWEVTPADYCCQKLQQCPSTIAQFYYKFNFFNPYPYKLYNCECVEDFRACLDDLKDDKQAREIEHLFFEVLDMKCTRKEMVILCDEYDEWFSCKNGTEAIVMYVDE